MEIIPREAVRPLYRRAMSTLRLFCREILPLPSFDVWLLDYETHRLAHVSAGLGVLPLPESMEPVAVEFRRLEHEAEAWRGTLEAYRGGDVWRGLIRFQRDGEDGHFRTGEIFREDDLQDLGTALFIYCA